jgi:hypothetical protein
VANLRADQVPVIPSGIEPFWNPKIPEDDQYDAEIDGFPCRWRCKRGTKVVRLFIRYERSDEEFPSYKDTWFASVRVPAKD